MSYKNLLVLCMIETSSDLCWTSLAFFRKKTQKCLFSLQTKFGKSSEKKWSDIFGKSCVVKILICNKKKISWPLGDTEFLSSYWIILHSFAAPTRDKFGISTWPCDIFYYYRRWKSVCIHRLTCKQKLSKKGIIVSTHVA